MKRKIIVFFIFFIMLITSYQHRYNEENKFIVENNVKEEVKIDTKENKNEDKIVTEKEETKTVDIIYNDETINMNLEDYVVGVVACEMPASFDIEALKAMAIAARTFALYKINTNKNYKLSTTTKDQCYISVDKMKKNWGNSFNIIDELDDDLKEKIKTAVNETQNQFMTYNDKVILSFYFSISNGYTENCENVFSQKLDYLKSVDSSWDSEYDYKEKTVSFTEKDFLKKLGINSSTINDIKVNKSKTGRASTVVVNGKSFKGTNFRTLLGLRSTDVEITRKDGKVYIDTKGYGHGVGMSQYGANAMAKKGYSYDEILKYYYTGIKINE